jgi:hypothetical protein
MSSSRGAKQLFKDRYTVSPGISAAGVFRVQ